MRVERASPVQTEFELRILLMDGLQVLFEIFEVVLDRRLAGARIVHHLPQGNARIAGRPREGRLPVPIEPGVVLQLPLPDGARQQLSQSGRAVGLLHVLDKFQFADQFQGKPRAYHALFFHLFASRAIRNTSATTDGESQRIRVMS